MRIIAGAIVAVALAGAVAAMASPLSSPPAGPAPLDDNRLAISTLVREDIFAGFIDKDMARFERGEKAIATLLASRPERDKAGLLAWQGGGTLYRAALANEAGKKAEYRRLYTDAMAKLAEAKKIGSPQDGTVFAVSGGVGVLFGDRLAKEDRAAVWTMAYENYTALCALQCAFADKLPPHLKGELMAGLVMSAQRTGHMDEMNAHLDKMLVVTKDTPYEAGAKLWKADAKAAATTSLGCKNCHDSGRLAPTLASLNAKAAAAAAAAPAPAAPAPAATAPK
jgi:hypothetical protein